MEDSKDTDLVFHNSIRHDIGRARNDQFAGAWHTTGSAEPGICGEPVDRGLDLLDEA